MCKLSAGVGPVSTLLLRYMDRIIDLQDAAFRLIEALQDLRADYNGVEDMMPPETVTKIQNADTALVNAKALFPE